MVLAKSETQKIYMQLHYKHFLRLQQKVLMGKVFFPIKKDSEMWSKKKKKKPPT